MAKGCLLLLLLLPAAGCGHLVAHALIRSPNRYSTWLAPEAPVMLAFDGKLLTNFARQYVTVGSPPARLMYRVVDPADYHLTVTSTHWLKHGEKQCQFSFAAAMPAPTNRWTAAPRGTVLLLHGYALAQFSLLPWALRLGEAGYRCVLVDLRGHGRSGGPRIYFGIQETEDLSQLLDALAREKQLAGPVSVVGESYGAALALRWPEKDARIHSVVAIAPYGSLSNAAMNIRHDYAAWVPQAVVRSGLKHLPAVLGVPAGELDTTTVLARHPVEALFVAGGEDRIAPEAEVERLRSLALPGSRLVVVPEATHETLAYFMDDLEPPLLAWLRREE